MAAAAAAAPLVIRFAAQNAWPLLAFVHTQVFLRLNGAGAAPPAGERLERERGSVLITARGRKEQQPWNTANATVGNCCCCFIGVRGITRAQHPFGRGESAVW